MSPYVLYCTRPCWDTRTGTAGARSIELVAECAVLAFADALTVLAELVGRAGPHAHVPCPARLTLALARPWVTPGGTEQEHLHHHPSPASAGKFTADSWRQRVETFTIS